MREWIDAARRIPPRRLPGKAVRVLLRQTRAQVRRWRVLRSPGELTDEAFRAALEPGLAGLSTEALVDHFASRPRPRFFLEPGSARRVAAWLKEHHPRLAERTVAAADAICAGVYNLLGSGPRFLGPEPDWLADFISGYRWRPAYHRSIDYLDLGRASDVKVPWELSRCQHFVTLGRAYALTGDAKYAAAFVRQLRSWLLANPCERTVNWGRAMEVALRAISWLWAFWLFQDAPEFTQQDRWRLLKSLVQHGRYIWDHPECSDLHINGNHCLSNGVGLAFLGILLPELREAGAWRRRGLELLTREMPRQIHPDGVNFEQGIGYHGLVLEFYYATVRLCQANDLPVDPGVLHLLERMIDFVYSYTRPDGRFPQIGDNDDGRLLYLDDEPVGSHRRHLAVGGVLFDRPDLLGAAGDSVETAAWLFGPERVESVARRATRSARQPGSRAFPIGGFYIMRHGQDYAIIDAGELGMRGLGGHGHNDLLTLELCIDGQPVVVDSGTYTYTRSAVERNRFRGTAAHNIVQVDDEEIARLGNGSLLWQIANDAHPTVFTWRSEADFDFFDGEHDGYERLPQPVRCRRRVLFDKRRRLFIVDDEVSGQGEHHLHLRFHLAPGLTVEPSGAGWLLRAGATSVRVLPLRTDGLDAALEDDWVSLGYGHRQPGRCLRFSRRGRVPQQFRTAFVYAGNPEERAVPMSLSTDEAERLERALELLTRLRGAA